jgi:ABC-type dipeptide/oligopeptide/nickel transport system ATPase component
MLWVGNGMADLLTLEGLGKRLKALLLKRSGLVLGLQGEAGIGKTYTAQSLLRQTPCTGFSPSCC